MEYVKEILEKVTKRQDEILDEGAALVQDFMSRIVEGCARHGGECNLVPRAFKSGPSVQLTWNEVKWGRSQGKPRPFYRHIPKGGRGHNYSIAILERRLTPRAGWALPLVVETEKRLAAMRRELAELGRVRLAVRRAGAARKPS